LGGSTAKPGLDWLETRHAKNKGHPHFHSRADELEESCFADVAAYTRAPPGGCGFGTKINGKHVLSVMCHIKISTRGFANLTRERGRLKWIWKALCCRLIGYGRQTFAQGKLLGRSPIAAHTIDHLE
jgi:hypothetical protein